MNVQRVRALVRKDWRELVRNKQILAPLVLVPLLFVVVLPSAVIALSGSSALDDSVGDLQRFLDMLPAGVIPYDYTVQQTLVYAVIVYMFAPFFLLIPVMVASITASSSFVGEKERRTIEGLLYTPLTNRELVLGKILATLLPAVGLTWIAFAFYTVLVNVLGHNIFGGVWFPNGTWIVSMVLLVPLVSFLAVSLIVAISGRATTMQGAQGSAMFLVLPIIALLVSQATGLFLFDASVVLIVSVVLLVLDVAAFVFVTRRFRRERIVTRL